MGSGRGCSYRIEYMKNFLIIVNALKDKNLAATERISNYIQEKGGQCHVLVSVDCVSGIQKVYPEQISPQVECILVLGGDGTFIRAVRDTVSCRLPLIGINMGTLGYLCELDVENTFRALDSFFQDHYILEERLLLCGEYAGEKMIAFNDIVIHRVGQLSMVSLTVSVNGEYLNTFKGDGIIVSTPTGSTGYSLSAGGPIVDPKARLLLITPINSHTLSSKSIVVSDSDEILIEMGSRRMQRDEIVEVSFDGDGRGQMQIGDSILIRKAEEKAQILKLSNISFLQNLRKKMENYN